MIGNYIICATPRSGSNLLCEVLSSLGFAGTPEEHLWDPPGAESEPLAIRWPRVLQAGAGTNGVFGLKLMGYQADRLEPELPAVLGMPGRSLGLVVAATLADPTYVYLTRQDRLRQAISLVRALQTSQWRSMDAAACAPRYDAHAIAREVQSLEQDEGNWEEFFDRNRVTPYRLTYEEVTGRPQGTVAALLSYLGHDEPVEIALSHTQHRRQADDVTEE
ncbi:MAG: Stf0 sulfotransferase family protein [Chloroflexota bacterium]|nr:Stf0 sulfotransferase family protein [Chloroflexota bacterium]